MRKLFICFLLGLGCLACRPNLPYVANDKIDQVSDLSELMWLQKDTAQPCFDLVDDVEPQNYTDKHFGQFADMSLRLQLSSKRLLSFSKESGFKAFANQQAKKAAALGEYARAKDGKQAAKTARSILETCHSCHRKY